MIEVEIKLPVSDRTDMEQKLRQLNFADGDLVEESDTYFNSDIHDFKRNDEALRVRRRTNIVTEESISFMTYKGIKLDKVSLAREELECGISDAATGEAILCAIGFRKLCPVRKLRRYYQREDMTVCADQVEGLGDFLEVEILVPSEEERANALERMRELLAELGHCMEETTRVSYLSMLQALNAQGGYHL